jgi:hypothetical protein
VWVEHVVELLKALTTFDEDLPPAQLPEEMAFKAAAVASIVQGQVGGWGGGWGSVFERWWVGGVCVREVGCGIW